MNTNKDTLEPSVKELAALMDDYFKTSFTARHTKRTIEIAHLYLPLFIVYLIKRTKATPLPSDYRAYCQQMRTICQDWINHLSIDKGYKYWTVHMRRKETARFFQWCVANGYMLVNPMRSATMPASPAEKKLLFTHEEYLKLVKVLDGHPVNTLFIIGYHTGFSPIDCIRLKWPEVDLENMVITRHRHKMRNRGGPPVVVPIIPGSDLHTHLLFLKAHPPEYYDEYTERDFVNPEMTRRGDLHGLQTIFKIKSQRAGLYIPGRSLGSLRHTFLSRLTNSGCDVALGCKMSGHSNPRAFAHYVKPDVDSMRKALITSLNYAKQQKSGVNKTVEVVAPVPVASHPPESEPSSAPQSPAAEESEEPEASGYAPEKEPERAPSKPGH